MKTKQTVQLIRLAGVTLLGLLAPAALGQGTINFNEPWIYTGAVQYENYYEQGFWFRREAEPPATPYDQVTRVSSFNGTPSLYHRATFTVPDALVFSRLNGAKPLATTVIRYLPDGSSGTA